MHRQRFAAGPPVLWVQGSYRRTKCGPSVLIPPPEHWQGGLWVLKAGAGTAATSFAGSGRGQEGAGEAGQG